MYNAYTYQPYQYNSNVLPPQQALQANGKASIDALRMSPNSTAVIIDTTAPIVWYCASDSLGNVTATPYDITPHTDAPETDGIEARLKAIEDKLTRMEEKYESDVSKRDGAEASAIKVRSSRRSAGDDEAHGE